MTHYKKFLGVFLAQKAIIRDIPVMEFIAFLIIIFSRHRLILIIIDGREKIKYDAQANDQFLWVQEGC